MTKHIMIVYVSDLYYGRYVITSYLTLFSTTVFNFLLLRIDNGDFHVMTLRFTFVLITRRIHAIF